VRIFTCREITADAVLASACLPFISRAVEIDGEAYWDGGYMGNPAIFPLIYHCETPDVVVVHINPMNRPDVPTTARDIMNRINEISFNSSLMREMRAIAFVSRLIEDGKLCETDMKRMRIHGRANRRGIRQRRRTSRSAFVDLEGLVVYVMFEPVRWRRKAWRDLVNSSRARSLDAFRMPSAAADRLIRLRPPTRGGRQRPEAHGAGSRLSGPLSRRGRQAMVDAGLSPDVQARARALKVAGNFQALRPPLETRPHRIGTSARPPPCSTTAWMSCVGQRL
jgi:hypothetical protein